jgi:hypothetical protein
MLVADAIPVVVLVLDCAEATPAAAAVSARTPTELKRSLFMF